MKKLTSFLLAAVLAFSALVSVAGVLPASAASEPEKGTYSNVKETDLFGEEWSGANFAKYKVTAVNVWATWCNPCVGELSTLQEAYEKLEPRGFNFISLLHDATAENIVKAKDIYKSKGMTYTTIIPSDSSPFKRLMGTVNAYPTTFFIDSNGNIIDQFTQVGAMEYKEWMQHFSKVMASQGGNIDDLVPTPTPDDTICGDTLSWSYDWKTTTLTISGTGAMYDFSQLSNDDIPWHFYADKVEKIIVEEGCTYIGNYAFTRTTAVKSIVFPKSLRALGDGVFYQSTVPDVVIPEGVVKIGSMSNGKMQTISLPASLTEIPDYIDNAFIVNCPELKAINVAEGNKLLRSVDGVLYSKDCSTIITYPSARDAVRYDVLTSAEVVAYQAFSACSVLRELHFKGNIDTLNRYAIYNNGKLSDIYFYGVAPTSCVRDNQRHYPIYLNYNLKTIHNLKGAGGWGKTFCGFTLEVFDDGIKLGDVNGDSNISSVDALVMLRYLMGEKSGTFAITHCDINGDGKVSTLDGLLLLRHCANWEISYLK